MADPEVALPEVVAAVEVGATADELAGTVADDGFNDAVTVGHTVMSGLHTTAVWHVVG